MRNSKYILAFILVFACSNYIAEPVACAQASQIIKGTVKSVGKAFGKKTTKEAVEEVGKKTAKEVGEVAGKKIANEGIEDVSRELTERAVRNNGDKILVRSTTNEVSDRAMNEIASSQVKNTLTKYVAWNIGKDASKIFSHNIDNIIITSSDDAAVQFAKRLGTQEAKESFENTAKRSLKLSQELKATEKRGIKQRVEKTYLSSKLRKTAIYQELLEIQSKGPIFLTEKDLKNLLENPKDIRNYILRFTGDKKNFQEFFIRLAMGNKEHAAEIMKNPYIQEYIKKSIRAGGLHEWLMAKNFQEFLLDPKWGEDGPFLALALTKFVQKTRNVNFKPNSIYGLGGHPSSGRANSTASSKWHKDLADIISKCNTKEELFLEIKKFAKETLTDESYREFCEIFTSIFKTAV